MELDTATVNLAPVILENDTVLRVLAIDIYPVLRQLASDVSKVLWVSMERKDDETAYYFRFVTPLEYSPVGLCQWDKECMGYVKYEDCFLLLSNTFRSYGRIKNGEKQEFRFVSKKIKYENSLLTFDPVELIYVIKDGLYYRLGASRYKEETKPRLDYDRQLLAAMKLHGVPDGSDGEYMFIEAK